MLMILTRVRGVDIHRFGTCYAYWVNLGKRAVRVSSIEGLRGESCGPCFWAFVSLNSCALRQLASSFVVSESTPITVFYGSGPGRRAC